MAAQPSLACSGLPLCFSSPNSGSVLTYSDQPLIGLRRIHIFRRQRCNGLLQLPTLHPQRAPQPTMALISPNSSNALFCLMASCAAFGQVMETKTDLGAKLSAPLVALLLGMALAGAGVVPSTSSSYDFVTSSIMPLAVALCLLETDVQSIFSDAGVTLRAFWYGALGTLVGTVISFKLVGHALGSDGWKIASSLCASYIGGTINYVATAQALGLTSSSTLAAGMAADNLAMAAYFALIMSIPDTADTSTLGTNDGVLSNNNTPPTVESISTSLAAASTACTLGRAVAGLLPSSFTGCGLAITALIASCFSIAAAQVHKNVPTAQPQVFAGSQILGAGGCISRASGGFHWRLATSCLHICTCIRSFGGNIVTWTLVQISNACGFSCLQCQYRRSRNSCSNGKLSRLEKFGKASSSCRDTWLHRCNRHWLSSWTPCVATYLVVG